MADENAVLHTANQRQKRKRSQPVSSISQGGILTVQEGQLRTQSIGNIKGRGESQSIAQLKTRAPSRYNLCSSLEYTARTYAQRYNNNQ